MFINQNFFTLNKSQKGRIKKNIFSGFSTEIFQIVSQIFFAPLMILFWGVDNFGIWVFLLSIPNVLLVFNLNFTDAAIHELTKFRVQKKYNKAQEIFQNSLVLVFINIVFFSFLAFVFYFFSQRDISILKDFNDKDLYLILIFLVGSIYLNLFASIFTAVLHSYGKLHYGYNVSLFTDLFSKILIALSGLYFDTLVIASIIFFIFTIIKFFLNFYYFLLYKNYLQLSFKFVNLKKILHLSKLSVGHTADILTNVVKNSGIIIILGIFYDPYIIGYIATVRTLFYFFPVRFFNKLNNVVYFEFSKLYSENKFIIIKKALFSYFKLVLFLLIVFFFLSIFFGPSIYSLWLSNKYILENSLFFLILIDVLFFIMRSSLISLFSATNKNIILGLSDLVLIVITVLMIYLFSYLGYSYVLSFVFLALSSFVSLLVGIFMFNKFFKKND